MTEILTETLDTHLLEACKQAAVCEPGIRSAAQGVAAFHTYQLARSCGWDEARRLVKRSSWFRHKRILKAAGIVVPKGDGDAPRRQPGPAPSPAWFGASTATELALTLARSPALIATLVNHRFRVVRPWGVDGIHINPEEDAEYVYDLDAWPVGAQGVVCELRFDASSWRVYLEHDDYRLDEDQRWVSVPLNEFLRVTTPEGGAR